MPISPGVTGAIAAKAAERAGGPKVASEGVWGKIGWLQLFDRAVETVKKGLPAFTHSIQVGAVGGPDADIRRIWYLAVSAAFGRFRNKVRTFGAAMSLDATWDITAKVVSIELVYQMNSLSNFGPASAALNDPGSSPLARLIRGPEQLTVGGDWDTFLAPPSLRRGAGITRVTAAAPRWLATLTGSANPCIVPSPAARPSIVTFTLGFDRPGFAREAPRPSGAGVSVLSELPSGAANEGGYPRIRTYPYRVMTDLFQGVGREPTGVGLSSTVRIVRSLIGNMELVTNTLEALPDSGRVITTNEKNDRRVQPPKPPVDGHTRGSLIGLVAQTLQDPCFLPNTPPCTNNPAGSGGYFVQPRGTPSSTDTADMLSLWNLAPGERAPWALGPNQGPDGYDLGPRTGVNYGD